MVERVGTCRVCGCTDDHACDEGCWWIESTLCSSCIAAQGHTVRMTRIALRWSGARKGSMGKSLAACSCGKFEKRAGLDPRSRRAQDVAIRRHWQCVVAEAREKETADA